MVFFTGKFHFQWDSWEIQVLETLAFAQIPGLAAARDSLSWFRRLPAGWKLSDQYQSLSSQAPWDDPRLCRNSVSDYNGKRNLSDLRECQGLFTEKRWLAWISYGRKRLVSALWAFGFGPFVWMLAISKQDLWILEVDAGTGGTTELIYNTRWAWGNPPYSIYDFTGVFANLFPRQRREICVRSKYGLQKVRRNWQSDWTRAQGCILKSALLQERQGTFSDAFPVGGLGKRMVQTTNQISRAFHRAESIEAYFEPDEEVEISRGLSCGLTDGNRVASMAEKSLWARHPRVGNHGIRHVWAAWSHCHRRTEDKGGVQWCMRSDWRNRYLEGVNRLCIPSLFFFRGAKGRHKKRQNTGFWRASKTYSLLDRDGSESAPLESPTFLTCFTEIIPPWFLDWLIDRLIT